MAKQLSDPQSIFRSALQGEERSILTEEAIRRALHASRIVTLGVFNSHGPLGLEQLAASIARHSEDGQTHKGESLDRINRTAAAGA